MATLKLQNSKSYIEGKVKLIFPKNILESLFQTQIYQVGNVARRMPEAKSGRDKQKD